MMIRWMPLYCAVCLAWFCSTSSAQINRFFDQARQDEVVDANDDTDRFMAAIAGEIRNELKTVFAVDVGMQIDQYRRFFELDQTTVKRLELTGKSLIDAHVKRFTDEVIQESWQRIGTGVGKGTTFKVNGRECILEGEERKDGGPEISMCMFRTSVLFSIKYQGGTTSTTLGHRLGFKPSSSDSWKEAVSHLSDEDFLRFGRHKQEFKRKKIYDLLMASLTQQLRLSDEQIEPVRKWVVETVELNLEQVGVFSGAKKALAQLRGNEPECLTEAQKNVLKLILSQAGYF